jgi:hypothetical protein
MQHGVANDAEMANRRGAIAERPSLRRRSRRQRPRQRTEFGD